jgi:conjugative relaxase-like TrwC/TraI family protein
MGREDYYLRELATDHEEYLSGHGESPGRWHGAGATNLGLQGEASPAGFRRMFEGRHPDSGELLGRPHGRSAVPAFDVVLRPTKIVSVLYGLGDPATGRAVLKAHHVGIREATAYLDEHLGTRRGHGATSTSKVRGCWPLASTTAPAARAIRCCIPTWWWPTASRARTDGGQPWTAGTCIGIG